MRGSAENPAMKNASATKRKTVLSGQGPILWNVIKEMRPFMLRQLLALAALAALLCLTAAATPLFFRLAGDAFDDRAVHGITKAVVEVEFCVWIFTSACLFVLEFRHEMAGIVGAHQSKRVGREYRDSVLRQSETTAATPSFAEGFGSVLDLGDTLTEYNHTRNGEEADALALRHDGLMLGRDLKQAIRTAAKNSRARRNFQGDEPTEHVNG